MEQIVLGSKMYMNNPNKGLIQWIMREFTVDNPEYAKKKKLGLKVWGTPKKVALYERHTSGTFSVPIGYFDRIMEGMEQLGLKYDIIDQRTVGVSVDYGWNESIVLRDYQDKAINSALDRSGLVVAPAGAGKTILSMGIIRDSGVKTLWLTHTNELMNQTASVMEKVLNEPVMKVGGGRDAFTRDGNLCVAMVQTLSRRPNLIDEINSTYGLVIVDEAHHVPSSMFQDILGKLKIKQIIGVTATPLRKDGRDYLLTGGIGDILYKIDREILHDGGKPVSYTHLTLPTKRIV